MNAPTTNAEVRDYLAEVDRLLDDLPDDERRELLDDLEQHLLEVAAEDDGSLRERLGPPEVYAAELRASAGLAPHTAASDMPVGERLRRRLRASSIGTIAELSAVRAVRELLPELRPVWWVLRGYLAAVAIDAFLLRANPTGGLPWPSIDGSTLLGTALVALCVLVSIVAGRALVAQNRARLMAVTANVVIVLMFVAALPRTRLPIPSDVVSIVQAKPFGFLQHGDGSPITGICAYDEDGKRVKDVRLFDQDGRPIDIARNELEELLGKIEGSAPFRRRMAQVVPGPGAEPFECPKKLEDLRAQALVPEPHLPPVPRRLIGE